MRVPARAGPHAVGIAFLKNPSALVETARQPYQAHINSYRHPRLQPAIYSITPDMRSSRTSTTTSGRRFGSRRSSLSRAFCARTTARSLAIAVGYRFGNFKASPETEAAVRQVMVAAGVTPSTTVVARTQQIY